MWFPIVWIKYRIVASSRESPPLFLALFCVPLFASSGMQVCRHPYIVDPNVDSFSFSWTDVGYSF